MKDFSMYRFFKGEEENPFDKEKQSIEFMYWFYERQFEEYETADWCSFFHGESRKKFMKFLIEEDYIKPSNATKKHILDLWLNDYFFVEKLYGEYGSENLYKKDYYSKSASTT